MIHLFSERENRILRSLYPFPAHLSSTSFAGYLPLNQNGKAVSICHSVHGMIYRIDTLSHDLNPFLRWDVGPFLFDISSVPPGMSKEFYSTLYQNISKNHAVGFICLGDNGRYYTSNCSFDGKRFLLIFDRDHNRTYAISTFKEGVPCAYFKFVDEHYVYAILNPLNVSKFVSPDILDEENMKKVESLSEDSNPVILRYRLRNFF